VFQIHSKSSLKTALLLGAATATAMSLTSAAMAQEQVETVVVTGSRIPQVGVYSSSPVTAVTSQEIKYEGTTNVETLLNNLPSAFADFGSYESNGSPGTATVNLRNLGSSRTLVLIDGKRLMPGDPSLPSPDLNQVPAALVDHVEVVTGGASAVYGSDAVAGVVNFVMRKDFEGVEFDGQWTGYQHDNDNSFARGIVAEGLGGVTPGSIPEAPNSVFDGDTVDLNAVIGVNSPDGKGNITMYGGFRHLNPVTEDTRDFSACGTQTTGNGSFICAGSSTAARVEDGNIAGGRFQTFNAFDVNGQAVVEPGASNTVDPLTGAIRPFTNADRFNFAPLNYLQRPDQRYTFGAMGHYEFNKSIDVYSSLMFMDDHTVAQIAPSGSFFGTLSQVNCDNPLLTADEVTTWCTDQAGRLGDPTQTTLNIGRRDIEGGNRQDDLRHTAYRMVIGARGDLGGGWAYDIFGQYGDTVYQEEYLNDMSISRIHNSLLVNPDGNCQSADNGTDPNCVPWNIFQPNGVTAAAINYLAVPGMKEGSTQEWVAGASLTGDLGAWGIQSPWAKSPVALAVGTEYRQEELNLRTDLEFSSGDLAGQGGPTLGTNGGYDLTEGYGEIRVPIAQDMPFFQDLTLNGGYRYSSYNTAGAVNSYKYGAEWQPIDDFRLRASFQRAVRAPNVIELFTPQSLGLWAGTDPCAAGSNTQTGGALYTFNQCKNTGVTQLEYGDGSATGDLIPQCVSGQCGELGGGNLKLKPETSDTKEYGIVLTPSFVPGFTATVDYFDIKLEGAIGVIPEKNTLSGCALQDIQSLCDLIHRSGALGGAIFGTGTTAGYVTALNINTGRVSTSGVDVEANYTTHLEDWGMGANGSLSANFLGTWTQTFTNSPFPGFQDNFYSADGSTIVKTRDYYECSGLFGVTCGTPIPKWRHKLRVTWTSPWDFDLSLDWRHMSSVKFDGNQPDDALGGPNPGCQQALGFQGVCDLSDAKISSYDYLDISGDYTIREGINLHAGVQNVFDKDPPLLDSNGFGVSAPPFGNGNTYPQVYDALGRTIFLGVTVKY
jgi:iron complex outermembrane recepter protein